MSLASAVSDSMHLTNGSVDALHFNTGSHHMFAELLSSPTAGSLNGSFVSENVLCNSSFNNGSTASENSTITDTSFVAATPVSKKKKDRVLGRAMKVVKARMGVRATIGAVGFTRKKRETTKRAVRIMVREMGGNAASLEAEAEDKLVLKLQDSIRSRQQYLKRKERETFKFCKRCTQKAEVHGVAIVAKEKGDQINEDEFKRLQDAELELTRVLAETVQKLKISKEANAAALAEKDAALLKLQDETREKDIALGENITLLQAYEAVQAERDTATEQHKIMQEKLAHCVCDQF